MGAIAAAIAAGAGTVPGTGLGRDASGPYQTVVLDADEQRSFTIGDGETFGNVLIDQTAPGSMCSLIVESDANDWTIRNVGWKGVAPTGGDRRFTFLINARGNGSIENIFIDQRNQSGEPGSDVGGIWTYSDSHHGHIECSHNFIAGCGNNASYPSGDGWSHREATGTISHYRSYHRDNTVANFRPGMPACRITECVSVTNDPRGTRGPYPSTGSQLTRAVWAWHHPNIRIENSAIWHDPGDVQPASPFWATYRTGEPASEGPRCELTVRDCDINESWTAHGDLTYPERENATSRVVIENLGTEPTVAVLGDGVPTTAEMAAAGERELPPTLGTAPSGGTGYDRDEDDRWSYEKADSIHTTLPYELVLDHVKPGAKVRYEIEIDGTVEAGEWASPPVVRNGVATGRMGPLRGLDNIYFDGDIGRFSVDNADHARFYLADAQTREVIEEIDPATVVAPDPVAPATAEIADDGTSTEPKTITPAEWLDPTPPDWPEDGHEPKGDEPAEHGRFDFGIWAGIIGLGTSAYVLGRQSGRF